METQEACKELVLDSKPKERYTAPQGTKPFTYVPLCSACAEHSQTVFRRFCAGCEERKRLVDKARKD